MAKSKTIRHLRGGTVMWSLIMTVYISGYVYMETLQGFQTEQACRYAGAQQEVALRNDFKLDTNKYYTFICVPK